MISAVLTPTFKYMQTRLTEMKENQHSLKHSRQLTDKKPKAAHEQKE